MKKIFILLIVSLPLLVSCELETSDNGDLDGFWHLTTVDTLANGVQTDMVSQKIFWSFQKDLLQLRGSTDSEKELQEFYLRFVLKDDQLLLSDIHLRDREKDDPQVDETTMPLIYKYGIRQLQETFKVLKLDNKEMIIQNNTLRLRFTKM